MADPVEPLASISGQGHSFAAVYTEIRPSADEPNGARFRVVEGDFPCPGPEPHGAGVTPIRRTVMRKYLLALTCSIAFAIGAPAAAFAQTNPTTGQPGTTAGFNCGTSTAPVEPGNAANAPGSAFNETSPGTAGTVYAGNGPGSVNHAGSTAAVSQYDAACRQLSSH